MYTIPSPEYLAQQQRILEQVAAQDLATLQQKESTYKGSWRKRGGIGAFMMLARKWDRLENMLDAQTPQFDIFKGLQHQDDMGETGNDGSLLAEIRDLRRYLMLVEANLYLQKMPASYVPIFTKRVASTPPMTIQQACDLYEDINPQHSDTDTISDTDAVMEHQAVNNPDRLVRVLPAPSVQVEQND